MNKIYFESFDGTVFASRRGFPPNGTQRAYAPGSGVPSIPWGPKLWWQPDARDGSGQPYDGSSFGGGAAQAAVVQNVTFAGTIGGNTAAVMDNTPGPSALALSLPATPTQFSYANGLTWGMAVDIVSAPTFFQFLGSTSPTGLSNGWGLSEPTGGTGTVRFWVGDLTTGGVIDWSATLGVHVLMGVYDPVSGDMELFVDGVSIGTTSYVYNPVLDTANTFTLGGPAGYNAVIGNYGPFAQYGEVLSPEKFGALRNYLFDYAGVPIP